MLHFHTYLLTPWCRVLLEKLTGLQLVKKLPAFHGTRRFTTALTSVRHLSLSWASPIQSIYPHPTSWRSILILSAHLRLGLHSGLFPSGFPSKTLYTTLSSPIHATCPAHLILLDLITRTIFGEEYKSFSSSFLFSVSYRHFSFPRLTVITQFWSFPLYILHFMLHFFPYLPFASISPSHKSTALALLILPFLFFSIRLFDTDHMIFNLSVHTVIHCDTVDGVMLFYPE